MYKKITRVKKAWFMICERLSLHIISPYIRACFLRMLGAQVGKNVRIYESRFMNLEDGFRNLIIEDDVHIGMSCLIDLSGKVLIRKGAAISPNVTIISHSDPGISHGSPLGEIFPPVSGVVEIGSYSWIGTGSIILHNARIGNCSIIGAGTLVNKEIPSHTLSCGIPARIVRYLDTVEATT